MLARKIAVNTVISVGARILGILLALVTIGLTTRYLTKNTWGEYSIMVTFGGIFAVIAEFGLYQLMLREISKPDANEPKIASNIFTLRLFFSLFIFALAPLISLFFPYSTQARWGILVGMVGFWFLSISQVLMGVFQKYFRMDRVSFMDLAARLLQLALVFGLIKIQASFLMIVAAFSFSSLVYFVLIYWLAKKYIKLALAFDFSFWRQIFKQSLPLALANILIMIYFSSDALFLSILKPAADVGIYRLPYKILESLIFFPSMFVGLVMPSLARAAFNDQPFFKNILQRSSDVLLIFAIPLVLGTFILSPTIINLLGGGSYTESVGVLNILMIAVGTIFLGTLFSFSLIALGQQRALLGISAVGAIFNVAANLILIPRYSYYAAAATTVLTELIVTVLMVFIVWRTIHFLPSFKVGLKSLAAASAMAALLWFINSWNIFLLLSLGVIIYFGALYSLGGFSLADVLALFKKEKVAAI